MKANELRIGNYVYFHGDVEEINMVDGFGVIGREEQPLCSIDEFEPIPLTEEWLLRFGFEKIRGLHLCKGYSLNSGEYLVYIDDRGVYLKTNKNIFIKYVHQLQNLYFALTGEELVVKE